MLPGRPVKYEGEAGTMRPCDALIGGKLERSMGGAAMDARVGGPVRSIRLCDEGRR